MNKVEVFGASDKGIKRSKNQDSFLILDLAKIAKSKKNPAYLFAVADGMGGHFGGELASETAIEILKVTFLKEAHTLEQSKFDRIMVLNLLEDGFKEANNVVYEASNEDDYRITMGSTLVAAFISDKEALIANVGDSRAYLFKKGKLKQISRDHTYIRMQAKKLKVNPKKLENSGFRNIITRAIGAQEDLRIDTFIKPLKKNQFLLLCSDGLYGELSENEIEDVLSQGGNTKTMVQKLIAMANRKGGRDNITVILAKFLKGL